MRVTPLSLPEVLLIEPKVFGDARGFFLESFHAERYRSAGIALDIVQDNLSQSRRGVLRGLHFQHPHAQGKLVSVLKGEILDVAVDVRVGSPSFGRWTSHVLSEAGAAQIWIPPGFAHGFYVLSAEALFSYKCTAYYSPEDEATVLWNDPAIGIDWPTGTPQLSEKDQKGLRLADIPRSRLPHYREA
jgi:dTDP-4-dehydrorhamnose 3,5-epimerase